MKMGAVKKELDRWFTVALDSRPFAVTMVRPNASWRIIETDHRSISLCLRFHNSYNGQ